MNPTTYTKVAFSSQFGKTAGLIFETDLLEAMTLQEISRHFPYSEAMKMQKILCSPPCKTWEEAFLFEL